MLRIGGELVVIGIPKTDITVSAFDLAMKKYHITAANNAATPAQLKDCAEFTAKHRISSPSEYYQLEDINKMISIMQKEAMGGKRMVVKFDTSSESARL